MTDSLESAGVQDVYVRANVYSWRVGETHAASMTDPEIRKLIEMGILELVDEETRKLLPPPKRTSAKSGCGCG